MHRTRTPSVSVASRGRSLLTTNAVTNSGAPLGKKELLAWAEETSGVYPCSRLVHLRDGLVLLGLAQRLYPRLIRRSRITARYRGKKHATTNWELLLRCMAEHGIPDCLTRPEAISLGEEGDCLNSLVLFYFLHRLARSEDFTADFTFPIDPRIANYLQSPASLVAVRRKRCDSTNSSSRSNDSKTGEGRRGDHWGSRASNCSMSESRADANGREGEGSDSPSTPSSSVSCASPSSLVIADPDLTSAEQQQTGCEWISTGTDRRRQAPAESTLIKGKQASSRKRGNVAPLTTAATEASVLRSTHDIHAVRVDNALLREELDHVRAVSKLHQLEQQGRLELELASAEAKSAAELAELRMTYEHAIRRLELLSVTSVPGVAPTVTVKGKEREFAVLRGALATAEERYDALFQRTQSVLAAISSIGGRGGSGAPRRSDEVGKEGGGRDGRCAPSSLASVYEEAVVDSLLAQVQDALPPIVLEALTASLQSLLCHLRQLRATNARLQWELDHQREVFGPSRGYECADRNDHAGEGEAARVLRELEAARRTIATLKDSLAENQAKLHEKALKAGSDDRSADAAKNRMEEIDALNRRWATRLRACEERYASLSLHTSIVKEKAARDAQECKTLYEKVTSLIGHFCVTGAAPAGEEEERSEWLAAADGLRAALAEWSEGRGSLDAMEAALQEQCETIARLRRELRAYRKGEADGGVSLLPSSAVVPVVVDEERQRVPSPSRRHKNTLTVSSLPSSFLSPEELERRKRAILAKYSRC